MIKGISQLSKSSEFHCEAGYSWQWLACRLFGALSIVFPNNTETLTKLGKDVTFGECFIGHIV
jgi:hypothetical protein